MLLSLIKLAFIRVEDFACTVTTLSSDHRAVWILNRGVSGILWYCLEWWHLCIIHKWAAVKTHAETRASTGPLPT